MKEKYKVSIAVSIVILIGLLGNLYYKYLDTLPQRYTVGTVIKIAKPAKGGLTVQYYYFVDSVKHTEVVLLKNYKIKRGEKYLVKFPIGYEGEGFMLLNEPIRNNIEPPLSGWDKKPTVN